MGERQEEATATRLQSTGARGRGFPMASNTGIEQNSGKEVGAGKMLHMFFCERRASDFSSKEEQSRR